MSLWFTLLEKETKRVNLANIETEADVNLVIVAIVINHISSVVARRKDINDGDDVQHQKECSCYR